MYSEQEGGSSDVGAKAAAKSGWKLEIKPPVVQARPAGHHDQRKISGHLEAPDTTRIRGKVATTEANTASSGPSWIVWSRWIHQYTNLEQKMNLQHILLRCLI